MRIISYVRHYFPIHHKPNRRAGPCLSGSPGAPVLCMRIIFYAFCTTSRAESPRRAGPAPTWARRNWARRSEVSVQLLSPPPPHTHTQTHPQTHKPTHTQTHARKLTHTHTHNVCASMGAPARMCVSLFACARARARPLACWTPSARAGRRRSTPPHVHLCARACARECVRAYEHACVRA